MKILVSFLFFTLMSVYSFGTEFEKGLPDYEVGVAKKDAKLKKTEAVYLFTFNGSNNTNQAGLEITYQIDNNGSNQTVKLNAQGQFFVKTTVGSHNFIIYYNPQFAEIYTDKIPIKAQNRLPVRLNLSKAEMQYEVDKPVIYLYPEKETKVHVEVLPKGKFTFTYPKYENGWDLVAQPSGKLIHKENQYNFLFWEAKQKLKIINDLYSDGFVIDGSKTQEFLEKQLTDFGFTSEEKADFITFWGPKLATNEKWFIRFVVNEECNQFADLSIEPKPDHIYRFYILTKPMSSIKEVISPQEQFLEPIKRTGFVVFEWGGTNL